MIRARRIVFTGRRQAEWEEFEVPKRPGPHEVVVETIWSAVSTGTETAIYGGTHIGFSTPGATYPRYPYAAGYAATGRVIAAGSEAQGFSAGQFVCFPGKHASYGVWNVHESSVLPLPESLATDLAALARLGTISLNGIRLARITLGDSVVVMGAGLIGQFAAQFAQLSGGVPVVVVDRLAPRLRAARAGGVQTTIDANQDDAVQAGKVLTGGRGFDVVVEATGAAPVVAQSLELAARYGRVILLGSPRGRVEIDPYHHIHSPGVTVIGGHARTTPSVEGIASRWTPRANFELVLNLLAAGRLEVAPLVSHRLPAAEAIATFEALVTRPEEHLGVLFDWRSA